MPTLIFISASGVSTHGPKSSDPPNEPNPSVATPDYPVDKALATTEKPLPA